MHEPMVHEDDQAEPGPTTGVFHAVFDAAGACLLSSAPEPWGFLTQAPFSAEALLEPVHPADRDALGETLKAATSRPQHRMIRTDPSRGMIRHFQVSVARQENLLSLVWVDLSAHARAEVALRNIIQGAAGLAGKDFLRNMVIRLAAAFECKYAFVGEVDPANIQAVTTLALCVDGQVVPNMTYSLEGTPCENVVGQEACFYPCGIQALFPEDQLLQDMGVEGYLGTPLFASDGRAIGLVVVLSNQPLHPSQDALDILRIFSARAGVELERMRAEEALAQAQKLMLRTERMNTTALLGAGLTHDLNNLLSAITAFSDLGIETLQAGDIPDLAWLKSIRDAAHKAGEMTAQLMAFGREQSALSTFEVGSRLERLVQVLKVAIPRGVELRVQKPSEALVLQADPLQLEQILVNLVLNARDALRDHGHILIRCSQEAGPDRAPWLRLCVEDDGPGMPPEVLARAFEPFYSTKSSSGGSGLGLPSVRALVTALGGTLTLDSAPGSGTRFEILLPLPGAT